MDRESQGLLFTLFKDHVPGAYLSTLVPALLNVRTPTLGFKGYKTDELLNGPCPLGMVWMDQEDSWAVCGYWRKEVLGIGNEDS